MKRNFWLPIVVTVFVILAFGLVSGVATKGSYQFESQYENYGWEVLTLELKNGRSKMRYVGYDRNGRVVQTKQLFGVFLRWGITITSISLNSTKPTETKPSTLKICLSSTMTTSAVF